MFSKKLKNFNIVKENMKPFVAYGVFRKNFFVRGCTCQQFRFLKRAKNHDTWLYNTDLLMQYSGQQ